jgi:hypothetical protein
MQKLYSYFYHMFKCLIHLLFTGLILASCSKGHGNKLTDDAIDVYFEFKEDETTANKLGKFWKEKGLTGERKLTIRLTKDDEFYYVQIIANDPKNTKEMPFNELALLMKLQQEMDTTVFKDLSSCQIVICDGSFKPITNINH